MFIYNPYGCSSGCGGCGCFLILLILSIFLGFIAATA